MAINAPNNACTGRWGFCAIYKHFSGFEFFLLSGIFPARPPAANASRSAADSTANNHYQMDTTLIIFSGLAGTGKTTLARLLCHKLRIPLVSFDYFVDYSWPRRLLNVEVLTDDELLHILFSTADLHLSLGLNVVMDMIFSENTRNLARNLAHKHKVRFRAIHTFCSDEIIWHERVIGRAKIALSNETPATWEGILSDRNMFQAWNPEEALFVDAINSIEFNLSRILEYIDARN